MTTNDSFTLALTRDDLVAIIAALAVMRQEVDDNLFNATCWGDNVSGITPEEEERLDGMRDVICQCSRISRNIVAVMGGPSC